MDDLISRKAVETAIKEFFKKQVDKLPKKSEFEEMFDLCGLYLELNVELLNEVENIPIAYDVDKVLDELDEAYNKGILGDYHRIVKGGGQG